jgi:RHS repeat-associated protein
VTTYTRDAKARVTQMVKASGTALVTPTTYTWHATFNLPTQIVRPGLTTDLTYDTQGRLTSKTETDTTTHTVPYSTNGQTRTWAYTWSLTGQLLTVDGPLAGVTDKTTYTYDTNGYLATVTNNLGQTITINTVNSRGQPTQVTDANGTVIDIAYDGLANVTSIIIDPGPNQAVTSFRHDVTGQITQVTLPNDVVLTFAYDAARRLTSITNGAGERIDYTYDNAGNIIEADVKDSSGTIVVQVRRTFDELSRVLKKIGAADQETQFAYDKVGNNTQIIDPRSKVYGNTFDELNRLMRETDPDFHQTNTAFTGRDDITSVTDMRGNATAFVRNGWSGIIRETSPDRGVTDYVYDAGGRMTQRTDARGQVTTYGYDGLGRLTSRSFPGAPSETITWSYDSTGGGNKGVGRLTGITDPSGTVAYTYDALGHMIGVVRVIGARAYRTGYTYDKAGKVTEITLPSGRIVTITRDSLARVTSVTTKDDAGAPSNTVVSSAAWRPFGPLASLTFGNAIGLALAYDSDGRVTDIDAAGDGITVQDLTYGYGPASNITAIGDNLTADRNQTLAYDNLNRLTSATGPYGTNTYSYDEVGNRTRRTVTVPSAGTENYTMSSTSNRLASISGAVNRSFTYTASGQAETDQRSPSHNWTYTTNEAGRMSAATLNGVTQATFAYDADERRVVKTNPLTGAVTHYIFDAGGRLLAEMDGATGGPIREYIRLGALPVGYVDRLGASGASRLFFIHTDQVARPLKITDSSRNIVWGGVFAPFGEIHSITGSIDNVLMFPGQIYDPETGLTQNGHRDYDPIIGRYLESDPKGIASTINTYAYAGGNPVSRTDPTGMSDTQDDWLNWFLGTNTSWPVVPYGTLYFGPSAGVVWSLGGSINIGVYHDVTCATCYWDWSKNWGLYGTFSGHLGHNFGGSGGVTLGYSRYASFRGRSQGLSADIPVSPWTVVSPAINIDPNATHLAGLSCLNVTGWQVTLGLGEEVGYSGHGSWTETIP